MGFDALSTAISAYVKCWVESKSELSGAIASSACRKLKKHKHMAAQSIM